MFDILDSLKQKITAAVTPEPILQASSTTVGCKGCDGWCGSGCSGQYCAQGCGSDCSSSVYDH